MFREDPAVDKGFGSGQRVEVENAEVALKCRRGVVRFGDRRNTLFHLKTRRFGEEQERTGRK